MATYQANRLGLSVRTSKGELPALIAAFDPFNWTHPNEGQAAIAKAWLWWYTVQRQIGCPT